MLITAKPRKKHGVKHNKQWKKGQSGNPSGGTKDPDKLMLRKAKKLTRDELHRLMNTHIWMTQRQLMAVINDKTKEPMLSHMIASIIQRGVIEGSVAHLNFILTTIIGKTGYSDPGEVTVQNLQINAPTMDQGPSYVVELNDGGKFKSARPREVNPEPLVIDVPANAPTA